MHTTHGHGATHNRGRAPRNPIEEEPLRNMGLVRKSVALAAVGAIGLTACSTTATDDGGDEGTQNITFTYGHEQELDAYNPDTANTNATKNVIPVNRVLPGFWRYGADGSIDPEEEFGTFEKVSDDPLTVKYTFNENAVWSDGEPIDCDDAYLAYIAQSGKYKEFEPAGTTGYDLIGDFQCADGDKEFTVVFDEPFADWNSLFGRLMPAHIVEQQAGVEDFVAAAEADDKEAMAAAGDFWTNGWVMNPGELDEAIMPASGPYKLTDWQPGQSVTLTANEAWWGTPPAAQTIVIRFIAQDGQAQALENGEINAMDPQPNPDLISQLQALGDSVTVESADTFIFEHLDPNFAKGRPLADDKVREAFALCVPRQQIVDNLIKPQNENAVVQNSRYIFPFQSDYAQVADNVTDGTYDEQNIEAAKALLEEADAVGTKVKIGYIAENQRRADQFALIQDSCNKAGFDIVDGVTPTFFDGDGELVTGNYDVAMFAWSGSPLVSGSSSTYVTEGGNNFQSYSNATVDELTKKLDVTTDRAGQLELITQIETELWNDLATIPLFTHPGLAAYGSNTDGVVFNASQGGLTWNAENWTLQ